MNGQPVRLRSDDGINLSKAGKRKVAFYAEKPLLQAAWRNGSRQASPQLAGAESAGGRAAPTADIGSIDRTAADVA